MYHGSVDGQLKDRGQTEKSTLFPERKLTFLSVCLPPYLSSRKIPKSRTQHHVRSFVPGIPLAALDLLDPRPLPELGRCFCQLHHLPREGQAGLMETQVPSLSFLISNSEAYPVRCSVATSLLSGQRLNLMVFFRRAFVYEGFLTDLECDHLISLVSAPSLPQLDRCSDCSDLLIEFDSANC